MSAIYNLINKYDIQWQYRIVGCLMMLY